MIKNTIDGVLTLVGGILTAALKLMQGDTDGALNTLKDTFKRVWDDIKGVVQGAWDFINGIIKLAEDGINRLLGKKTQAEGVNVSFYGANAQPARSANNINMGGDTYNISGGVDTARAIKSARTEATRSATLRAAWG